MSAWVSHTEVGPLSRPTRTTPGARLRIKRAIGAGSDATFPSKIRVPSLSRMRIFEGKVASEPAPIARLIRKRAPGVVRVG
ncbi:MAG: hypothetical protein ACLPKT_25895, partial [Methylocella sp.]